MFLGQKESTLSRKRPPSPIEVRIDALRLGSPIAGERRLVDADASSWLFTTLEQLIGTGSKDLFEMPRRHIAPLTVTSEPLKFNSARS